MKKWTVLALTLTLSLLSSCTEKRSSNSSKIEPVENTTNIVGGTAVLEDDSVARKVLSFQTFKDPEVKEKGDASFVEYQASQCTASAVTPRIILTAAHCISSTPGSFAQVEVVIPEAGVIDYKAIKTVIHPQYNKSNRAADVALVLLEADLPYNIDVLQLPEKNISLNLKSIQAAGYGRTSGKQSASAELGVLYKTNLDILSYSPSLPTFSVDQTHGKGICQGDSGGPAMVEKNGKTVVVGVASETEYHKDPKKEEDQCNYHGLYVNVQFFMDWIEPTIKALSSIEQE